MIQNYNGYKVLRVFMETPLKGFGLRDLCRRIRLGPASVLNYLKKLESDGLIVKKKLYGKKLYFANRESRLFRLYKQFETVRRIEESKLIYFLNDELAFPTVILFGSKSSGEDTEKSDIDIAIITNSKKEVDVEKYEARLGSKIHILVFDDKAFESMKTKKQELFNNIINGRVLSGYLKVV
ncbi:MAG: nucleotidyltransferase domain-containing protein [Candidatus Aenigmarchaeota archaeon]|nr:nucleotidyltransferase domain-containing protein [Candidatus Aenigmarchaeota archaeon]